MTTNRYKQTGAAGRATCRISRARRQRGGVFIAVLAFVLIISIVIAGMATLSTSHYARSYTESDYNAALSLAEAGLNYELWNADKWLAKDPYSYSYLQNIDQWSPGK